MVFYRQISWSNPNLEEIILDVIIGSDVLVIMVIGSGKSVCYQLSMMMLDGHGGYYFSS
jgi:superfamily II DNA helicase RecQ